MGAAGIFIGVIIGFVLGCIIGYFVGREKGICFGTKQSIAATQHALKLHRDRIAKRAGNERSEKPLV